MGYEEVGSCFEWRIESLAHRFGGKRYGYTDTQIQRCTDRMDRWINVTVFLIDGAIGNMVDLVTFQSVLMLEYIMVLQEDR